jgi:hypothetical protein
VRQPTPADGQTIHVLHIDGSSQHVHVGHGCSIGAIEIDGVACELLLPVGASFTIIDDGLSTTVTSYTSG